MPSSNQEEWEAQTLSPSVSRFPQRKDRFLTDSGIEIDALYGPEGSPGHDFDYDRDLGYPGEYPYTRGGAAEYLPGPYLDHAPVFRVCNRR